MLVHLHLILFLSMFAAGLPFSTMQSQWKEFKQLLFVYVCLRLHVSVFVNARVCACVHACVCTEARSKQGKSVRSFVLKGNVDFTLLNGLWLVDYG